MLGETDTYNRPNIQRIRRDIVALAQGYLRLTKCPSGRPVISGYVCAHCGIDYTDEDNKGFCGQPVEEDGFTPFDATVAKRIMSESARKSGDTE